MKKKFVLLTATIAVGLTGCFVPEEKYAAVDSELKNLKKEMGFLKASLGEFRYLGLDPGIEVIVTDVEFSPPEGKYSSPTVGFKSSLKQTNADFPLDSYSVNVTFSVLNSQGAEVYDFIVGSKVRNGVLALAETKSLYSLRERNYAGYKLVAKDYSWFPVRKLKPK